MRSIQESDRFEGRLLQQEGVRLCQEEVGGGEAILAYQFDVPEDEDDEENKIDDTSALKSA